MAREQRGRLAELIALRHAQSLANAAFAAAEAAGRADAGLSGRDAEVALSTTGRVQAVAAGNRLAGWPPERQPEVFVCSPYRRAQETLQALLAELRSIGRAVPPVETEERLRDRETGVLELLTPAAVRDRFPEEVERQHRDGELHYRPPGGESLADVGTRVAALLEDLAVRHADRRVLLVTHDAVVLMLRYVIDDLSVEDILRLLAAGSVRNASVTCWRQRAGRLELTGYDLLPDEPEVVAG